MAAVIFLCPRTGFKIQGLTADEPADDAAPVSVDCPLCRSIHLVKPILGKAQNTGSDPERSPVETQSDDKGRGLADNLAARMGLLAGAIAVLLLIAWRCIW